eukprot:1180094-Prorocentrum_minimum.AAC.1
MGFAEDAQSHLATASTLLPDGAEGGGSVNTSNRVHALVALKQPADNSLVSLTDQHSLVAEDANSHLAAASALLPCGAGAGGGGSSVSNGVHALVALKQQGADNSLVSLTDQNSIGFAEDANSHLAAVSALPPCGAGAGGGGSSSNGVHALVTLKQQGADNSLVSLTDQNSLVAEDANSHLAAASALLPGSGQTAPPDTLGHRRTHSRGHLARPSPPLLGGERGDGALGQRLSETSTAGHLGGGSAADSLAVTERGDDAPDEDGTYSVKEWGMRSAVRAVIMYYWVLSVPLPLLAQEDP